MGTVHSTARPHVITCTLADDGEGGLRLPHVYESGGDTNGEGGLVLVIHLMYINQEGILMGRVD